ncbi:MAG: TniQ family protein [Rhodanobacter sp.]
MTQLFPIPLLGVDTPQVESLASYVCRLALAHGVSARQMLLATAEVRVPGQLNGYSGFAATMVERLGVLTGQANLVHGTLLRLRHVLSVNAINSIAATRRWCPSCIADDVDRNEPGYDPLFWSIKAVSLCLKHDVWLVSACPHCLAPQTYLPYGGAHRTRCSRCRKPLSAFCDRVVPSAAERWCRREISALLVRGGDMPFQGEPIRSFLLTLVKMAGGEIVPAAREIGFEASVIRGFLKKPAQRPTFASVLSFSASVQQPVDLLLSDPVVVAAQGRFAFGAPHHEISTRSRLSVTQRQELERSLRKAAYGLKLECPPSVASICRAHGATQGCARYAFPMLSSRVTARRSQYLAKRMESIERRAAQVVQREFLTLTDGQLQGLSQKKFVERLMLTSGLPKRVLSKATRMILVAALQQRRGTDKVQTQLGETPNGV